VTDIVSLGAERGTYHLNAAKHNVVLADKTYQGEIKVGITFTATQVRHLFRVSCPWMPLASVLEAWSKCMRTTAGFLLTRQFNRMSVDAGFQVQEDGGAIGGWRHGSFNQ